MRKQMHTSPRKDGEGKRVGIWIRVSTEDQARGESPEHHEARARMYAQAKDWHVVTVYHLEGVSGKAIIAHPEAQRMLGDIKSGAISALIFSKLARLARNTRELLDFSDLFRDAGADLVSLQESIDTSTPSGRLFYTLIAAMAQWEREEIAERVAASVPVRAKLGKRISGAAPYGYAWVDGKLLPDEMEAPVRRLMYELFRGTKRVGTVARLLNERGYRTRKGGAFTDVTVRRLLLDPTAKGLRRANYTRSLGDGKAWELKPKEDWVEVPIPAIIDEAIWEECAAVLGGRTNGLTRGRRPVHLFTGAVHCACGRKMYVPSNTPKWVCYDCRNKIPTADLETVFAEQLKSFVFSATAVADHVGQIDSVLAEKRGLVESLLKDAQSVRAEQEKLYRLYLDGGLSAGAFRERNDPLEARKEQLAAEIPRLQGEVDFLAIRHLSSAQVLSQAQTLYGSWSALPFDAKREIVETIVDRIVVGKGEVEITLCAPNRATVPPQPQPPPPAKLSALPEVAAESQRIHRGSSPPPG
jgi:site-specific DNA recombinase